MTAAAISRNSLRLVVSRGGHGRREGVFLPPSSRLDQFAAASAERGLTAREAVRLALERFFALADAATLGLDAETSRRLLGEAARAVPLKALAQSEAARIRALTMAKPTATPDTSEGIAVPVPDRLLTRFGDRVPARAFRAAYVAEMMRWEIAAAFEGRTMGEWALRTLAVAVAA